MNIHPYRLLVVAALIPCSHSLPAAVNIAVDSSTTYQRMGDWEATPFTGEADRSIRHLFTPALKNTLYDKLTNELGISRLRVEIRSSAERTDDVYRRFIDGAIDNATYKTLWYAPINDNSSPTATDAARFHFSELDEQMDDTFLPMSAVAAAAGRTLALNVCYVGFNYTNALNAYGGTASLPAEYAEFVLATYEHLQSRYSRTPNYWEIVLEPDNSSGTDWPPALMGEIILAAGDRLLAAGHTPCFIASSAMDTTKAATYIDAILGVLSAAGKTAYLAEISYHTYSGATTAARDTLAARSRTHGIPTAQLEYMNARFSHLYDDLTNPGVSSWQKFALSNLESRAAGLTYYVINDSTLAIHPGDDTLLLRQVFRYVRRGALRLGATSDDSAVRPLAFLNSDGGHTVVLWNSVNSARDFVVSGLPAGEYGVNYSTPRQSDFNTELPSIHLAAGASLTTRLPRDGVLTLYRKDPPPPPAAPSGLGITAN